jgi:DNA-directed RNA polymerase omega subunit
VFRLPENIESKYRFVTLASKRAEQLQQGALPRVESNGRKSTVVAQEEVALSLVELWNPNAEPGSIDAAAEEQEVE